MKPVKQEILGGDSTMPGVHGDCLRACVCSIFELPIRDVPHFVAEDDWYGAFQRWIESRGFMLGSAFIRFDEDEPTRLTGHPSDGIYWIADVLSPRLKREDGTPGNHAIVMCAGEVAWDPHPQRELGHLGFTGIGFTFLAPNPARLSIRPAVDPTAVVVAARRYLSVPPEAHEDAHFQLLSAVTQYEADLEDTS